MNVHINNILKVISKISLKTNLSRTIVMNQKSVKGNVAIVDRMVTVGVLIYDFQPDYSVKKREVKYRALL